MAHLLKRDTLGEIKLDEKDREKMKQAADHSLKKEKGQQNSVQTQSKGWETNDRGDVSCSLSSSFPLILCYSISFSLSIPLCACACSSLSLSLSLHVLLLFCY